MMLDLVSQPTQILYSYCLSLTRSCTNGLLRVSAAVSTILKQYFLITYITLNYTVLRSSKLHFPTASGGCGLGAVSKTRKTGLYSSALLRHRCLLCPRQLHPERLLLGFKRRRELS